MKIKALKQDLDENMVNLNMINHYKEKHKDFKEKEMDVRRAEEEIGLMKDTYETLRKNRHAEFSKGF